MEVSRPMLTVVHGDYDPEKPTDLGHFRILLLIGHVLTSPQPPEPETGLGRGRPDRSNSGCVAPHSARPNTYVTGLSSNLAKKGKTVFKLATLNFSDGLG